jgi:DNA gyrase/topoisomerase IV subunit B
MSKASKEIQVLNDFEHILARPTIYVGSVKSSEEQVPVVNKSGSISSKTKSVSVGMYKLFDEVFSNCVDEAKRMKSPMKKITVEIDSSKNLVSITDSGDGFLNGSKKNKKSGLSNVETAVSMLRAGSNFNNDEIEESLIGTNGMGVSLVNALSTFFEIETTNSTETYKQFWKDFVPSKPEILSGKKTTGTRVTFIPRSKTFDGVKWDSEILRSILVLKKRVLETEDKTKSVLIEFIWDGNVESISSGLSPDYSFKSSIGELLIWKKTEESASFAFVNSAMCTGIHQKIIMDQINSELEDSLGHHFYDHLLILNLPPGLVRFGDQNKTKFVSKREEVEGVILRNMESGIVKFFKSECFKSIKKMVDDRRRETEIKKIRKEKKNVKLKFSHKYFPPTTSKADNLFIVEGLSAMGSILQKRDPRKDGVYALKGKIKNARSLEDLSSNREIIELMQILNLDPDDRNSDGQFKNVIISTDRDPDGSHITSLLINLFHTWFPWMIEGCRVHILETPLISVGERSKKYYFSLDEFKRASSREAQRNVRYLKGLGSLSLEDWEFVMSDRRIVTIKSDKKSSASLEMAFGKSSEARKKWLSKIGNASS